MRTQIKVVFVCLLVHCVSSNEMSIFKSSNFAQAHQFKNHIFNSGSREPTSSSSTTPTTSPIQYMETPNFDIMLLSEENSNPTWRKYSELFQPKDLRLAPHIEVNFGNNENFPYPFIDLDRSDIEAVLALLGDKKHIFVLHPRNCKPHSSSLDEFENEFLPELLQQLHNKPTINSNAGRVYDMDPVIERILTLLDNDEQKILDDLRKSYEKPIYTNVNPPMRRVNNPRPIVIETQRDTSNSRGMKNHQEPKPSHQLRDLLYKVPCNEGYVFLIESQKNPMSPNALSDLLLRVMKVVTMMA